MRDADDAGFLDGGVTHQGVFEIDGADPFAAGLHQILSAVNDLDVTVFIHVGDVARAEPAVGGPPMRLVRRFIIARGDPRAADFNLAPLHPVPWHPDAL